MDNKKMENAKWAKREIDRIAEPRSKTAVILELCKRLGFKTKATLYQRLEGKIEFSPSELSVIAEYCGVEPPVKSKHANGSAGHHGNVIPIRRPPALSGSSWIPYPILGTVEAGAFREADLLSQVEPREHAGPPFPPYPNEALMAWEARGDSMNAEGIFDGTILFGVDFQKAGGVLSSNDIVVVEQNRGGLIERSVKAVARFPDRTEFQPRSSNPAHKAIVYKNGLHDEDMTVRVLTVVLGTYNPRR